MSSPNAEAGWTTRAPAKVNLDLRMRGRRADGYHLLSTVLQSVALADVLALRPSPGPFRLSCDMPGVPTDARNLAWRGAAAMAGMLGIALDRWHLHIDKHVPSEAGLGGGSSDAVAAARLVAAAAGVEVPPERLADVVRPLGADVAYFTWGGTMRGEGVGDELSLLPDLEAAEVVIVRPPFGVSTRDAYGWYDERYDERPSSVGVRPSSVGLRPSSEVPRPSSVGLRPWPDGPRALSGDGGPFLWTDWRNDLEAPVAARHPEIQAIVERLRDAGAQLAAMSGSGSACFGVFPPGGDITAVETAWPEGTRVWRTRLLSRAEYADATACVPDR